MYVIMNFTIKQARQSAGLTQEEMAKKMGMNRTTYIKIEKDMMRATIGQVCAVAEITRIPVTQILQAAVKGIGPTFSEVETQERRQKFVPESAEGPCEPGESVKCG